jgi:predicted RNA binding protein YcfA (HicA-like mRNA interferase family)
MLTFKEFITEVRISNMTNREIVQHLTSLGWTLARHKGDHEVYEHPKSTVKIPVPKHRGTNAPGTTNKIMRDSTRFDKQTNAA